MRQLAAWAKKTLTGLVEHTARFLESKAETRVFQVKEFAPALTEWSEAQILFERIQSEPRLVICGAGHVGASLAKACQPDGLPRDVDRRPR